MASVSKNNAEAGSASPSRSSRDASKPRPDLVSTAEIANPCVSNWLPTSRLACALNASPANWFKFKPSRQDCPGDTSYASKTSCGVEAAEMRITPGGAVAACVVVASCELEGARSLRRSSL